ncbi:CHAP domain-containing protein [Parasediminibacterium paludis]|uniref:CHAP domain-containing protein n=1 Tax=Parasediminibacterium paludis TaxID=908966 RepID=A0ABV8PUK4_9BACT
MSKALEVAQTQMGLQEIPKGSNWGPHVQTYLASVGIDFPASWCMAFVYWCTSEAAKMLGKPNPLVKTGGVLRQWNEINPAYKVKGAPQPGDIFIMDFGKGMGHTGFVTKVYDERIETIEGNSNDDGSREGYEVCSKPGGRKISTIKGFIRLPF